MYTEALYPFARVIQPNFNIRYKRNLIFNFYICEWSFAVRKIKAIVYS